MAYRLFEAGFGALALAAVPFAAVGLVGSGGSPELLPTETVVVPAMEIEFPVPGEYLSAGRPVAAPVEWVQTATFRIMKQQVSLRDYRRCVEDGACEPADAVVTETDVPVTGVSWLDAQAFARWYSRRTGMDWRLPTAAEVATAAGERFAGEPWSGASDDPANPAIRWLSRYREEAGAKRPADPKPWPRGHFGANTVGIDDFGGNVWEWTSTCYRRVALGEEPGTAETTTENCGVHVLEGRHRAYMSNFVRDGKSGGCAVGTPPENLGFRLVLEQTPYARAKLAAARLWNNPTGS